MYRLGLGRPEEEHGTRQGLLASGLLGELGLRRGGRDVAGRAGRRTQ